MKWYAYIMWCIFTLFSSYLKIIIHCIFGKLSFFKKKSHYKQRDKLSNCSVFADFNWGAYGFLLPKFNACHVLINSNHVWTRIIYSHCKWSLFNTAHLNNKGQSLQKCLSDTPLRLKGAQISAHLEVHVLTLLSMMHLRQC